MKTLVLLFLCIIILLILFPYNSYTKYPIMVDLLTKYDKDTDKISKMDILYYIRILIYYIIIFIYDLSILMYEPFVVNLLSLQIIYSFRLFINIIIMLIIFELIL